MKISINFSNRHVSFYFRLRLPYIAFHLYDVKIFGNLSFSGGLVEVGLSINNDKFDKYDNLFICTFELTND